MKVLLDCSESGKHPPVWCQSCRRKPLSTCQIGVSLLLLTSAQCSPMPSVHSTDQQHIWSTNTLRMPPVKKQMFSDRCIWLCTLSNGVGCSFMLHKYHKWARFRDLVRDVVSIWSDYTVWPSSTYECRPPHIMNVFHSWPWYAANTMKNCHSLLTEDLCMVNPLHDLTLYYV